MQLLLPTLLLLAPLAPAQKSIAPPAGYLLEIDGKLQSITKFESSSLRIEPVAAATRQPDLMKKPPPLRPSIPQAKLQLPLLPGGEAQAWIAEALAGTIHPRNLRILEATANGEIALAHTLEYAFFDSIELPAITVGEPPSGWNLGISSQGLGYAAGGSLGAPVAKARSGATGFRLQIEGIDTSRVRTVGPLRANFDVNGPAEGTLHFFGPKLSTLRLVVEGNDARGWLKWAEESRTNKVPPHNATLELLGGNGAEVLARINLGGLALTGLGREAGPDSAPAFVVDLEYASVRVQFGSK